MLGLLVLGQSARPDFTLAMREWLPNVSYIIKGALDDVNENEVKNMSKMGGDYPLSVKAFGRRWEIDRNILIPRLIKAEHALQKAGSTVSLLMCAGDFPRLDVTGALIYPASIMPPLIRRIYGKQGELGIGIMLPNQSQMVCALDHWRKEGFVARAAWAPPEKIDDFACAIRQLGKDVDIIVLDCMGFVAAHEKVAREETEKPVVSSLKTALGVAWALV